MEHYKAINIAENLKWNEQIRKRPGMYLGQVTHKGFVETLRKLITQIINVSNCNTVSLVFKDQIEGEITFKNILNPIRKDISVINQEANYSTFDLPILNALSSEMVVFFDSNIAIVQNFKIGETEASVPTTETKCTNLKIQYLLDRTIWGRDFKWNSNYLSFELREFCYLNPETKFEICEIQDEYTNINSYQFINGLDDRLEIEILNGIGNCYFKHHLIQKTDNYSLEAAFAFRQYSVDQNFIRTYVNNELTPENGTHLKGVISGLVQGVEKYLKGKDHLDDYKISRKRMKKGLICMINIKTENAVFYGSVKNRLANTEIIKPIARYVSEELYGSMKNDVESTKNLIEKFKKGYQ